MGNILKVKSAVSLMNTLHAKSQIKTSQYLILCRFRSINITCKKKSKKICRCTFPRPPMKATAILEPLKPPEVSEKPPEVSEKDLIRYRLLWKKVHELLQSIDEDGETFTHEVLLSRCYRG
jgi:hypothetical protein